MKVIKKWKNIGLGMVKTTKILLDWKGVSSVKQDFRDIMVQKTTAGDRLRDDREEGVKHQLEKDYEFVREELPNLLSEILKDSELENRLEYELIFRPGMKTARCKRESEEIHFGTNNKKMKNFKVARKTLVHEAIHALGVNHGEKMRSLNYYSQLSRDLFTNRIMERLGWEPPSEDETKRYSRRRADQDYSYVAFCPECGNKWYRKRKSKLIKHPKKYRCGECNSKLESRSLEE